MKLKTPLKMQPTPYLTQQGLSMIYNVVPGMSEFRHVNPYTMVQTEDTFLNRECNRKLKMSELLRFSESNIDYYTIFLTSAA
jgi:hypothetical protein